MTTIERSMAAATSTSGGRATIERFYAAFARLDAAFDIGPDGLIRTHRDRFDFWAWSRQALGTPGLLLGWTPFLRNKVRATAAGNLQKFLAAAPG